MVSQKLIVSVDASNENPELMSVEDVFSHVLELFRLVNQSEADSQGEIVWKLVSVQMNSPLTVIAEAVPVRNGVLTDLVAERQKRAFSRNYKMLRAGTIPREWSTPKNREVVSRVLARSRAGIGRTTVDVDLTSEQPIVITKEDADQAAVTVAINAPKPTARTKEQVGSIEGHLLQIASHYGHPAIQIRDRRTKEEIWCVVPYAFQHEVSETTSVEDVWKGSRVLVRGRIAYGTDGKVARVVASSVRRIEAQPILENAISDNKFTGGLNVSEYLEKFRDGNLDRS